MKTLKTLNSIAKSLNKYPNGLKKRFQKLNIDGKEIDGKVYYSLEEINILKKYLSENKTPLEYKYSIYDFKNELSKDYKTIKRCLDYCNIIGFTDLQNKTYYNDSEKETLFDFIKSHTSYELQQILAKNTFKKKYGTDNPMKNSNVKDKQKCTCVVKYGVDNVFCSKEIQNKAKIKSQEHFINKYGVKSPLAVKEIHNKAISQRNKLNDKFNLEKYITINELSLRFSKDETTIGHVISILDIPVEKGGANKYFIDKKYIEKLTEYFSISTESMISIGEKEIVNFVKSIYDGKITENNRTVISPKELDIFIPEKNIAIEFDGLYYHSELFLDKDYHLNKTMMCNEKDIDLIHVFEDDWNYKKDIVKSMIKSRLGIYDNRIFARNCKIKEIDRKQAKSFFDKNHLQGYAKTCDLYLGLFYNNELVQSIAMTFAGFHDGNVELTRMCTKLNTQVVGGFSKLMKNFCRIYRCDTITSYVYKAWFNGKGYFNSSWRKTKENQVGYMYVMNGRKIHRSCFRKSKLNSMYKNGKLKSYDENLTEHQNCWNNKIYRIYDCGTIKVEYKVN